MEKTISDRIPPGAIVVRGAIALGLAMGANVLIRVIATGLLNVDAAYEHLEWRDFLSTTAGVVILAILARLALERFVSNPSGAFVKIALVTFLLSLSGPLALLLGDDAADGGIVLSLTMMHVATAAIVIRALGTIPGREPAP